MAEVAALRVGWSYDDGCATQAGRARGSPLVLVLLGSHGSTTIVPVGRVLVLPVTVLQLARASTQAARAGPGYPADRATASGIASDSESRGACSVPVIRRPPGCVY